MWQAWCSTTLLARRISWAPGTYRIGEGTIFRFTISINYFDLLCIRLSFEGVIYIWVVNFPYWSTFWGLYFPLTRVYLHISEIFLNLFGFHMSLWRLPVGSNTMVTLENPTLDPLNYYVVGVRAVNSAGLATTATTSVALVVWVFSRNFWFRYILISKYSVGAVISRSVLFGPSPIYLCLYLYLNNMNHMGLFFIFSPSNLFIPCDLLRLKATLIAKFLYAFHISQL